MSFSAIYLKLVLFDYCLVDYLSWSLDLAVLTFLSILLSDLKIWS